MSGHYYKMRNMEKLLAFFLVCTLFVCHEAQDSTQTQQYPSLCGGELRASDSVQQFASPEYPIRYPPNQYCVWTITADPGKVVLIEFEDFELESICEYDNVSVYDVAPPPRPSPQPTSSTTTAAQVRRKRQAGVPTTPYSTTTTVAPTPPPETPTPVPTTPSPPPATPTPAPTTPTPAPTTPTTPSPAPTTPTPAPTTPSPTTTTTTTRTTQTTTTPMPTPRPTTPTPSPPTPTPSSPTTPTPSPTTPTPSPTTPTPSPTTPTPTTTTSTTTTRPPPTRPRPPPPTRPPPTFTTLPPPFTTIPPPAPPYLVRLCGDNKANVTSNGPTMTVVLSVDQNRQFKGFLAAYQQIPDSCASNPCGNRGTCVNDKAEGFVCRCKPIYGGRTCNEDITDVHINTDAENRVVNTGIVVGASQPKYLAFDLKACGRQVFKLYDNDSAVDSPVWWFYMYPRDLFLDGLYMMSIGIYTGGNDRNPVGNIFSPLGKSCRESRSFWVAWSTTYLRIGTGRVPGANGTHLISAQSINRLAENNLNVRVESDPPSGPIVARDAYADWIIYTQPNFTVPASCGGALTASNELAMFASPGWPGGYAPNLHCEWTITAPPGERISMKFQTIAGLASRIQTVDRDMSCKLDSLVIYDGDSATGAILSELCGNLTEDGILSTSNFLTVVFLTNSAIEYSGFVMVYASDPVGDECLAGNPCQNNGTCVDGFRSYRCNCVGFAGQNCTDQPPCASGPCINGGTCVDGPTGDSYSCRCNPVHFGTDCIGYTNCGGQVHALSRVQQLASPYYPSTYRSSMRCTWNINADPGDVIILKFDMFNTESCCDCLRVYDGHDSNSRLIRQLCGSADPDVVLRSTGNQMTLMFSSDGSIQYRGFLANFSIAIDHCQSNPCQNNGTCTQQLDIYVCDCADGWMGTHCEVVDGDDCANRPCYNGATCLDLVGQYECVCTQEFVGQNCTISNPCANNECQNGAECILTITHDFTTPPMTTPTRSPVGPWTGGGGSGGRWFLTTYPPWLIPRTTYRPQLGSTVMVTNHDLGGYFCYCSNRFSGNRCEVTLPCASIPCGNGGHCVNLGDNTFRCECYPGYYGANCSVYTGCGGNLTATNLTQKFANQGYPDRYPNNHRCEYRISAPSTEQAVIITFERFRTEGCCDCLYVYDGESTSQLARYCGSISVTRAIVSTNTNMLRVVFNSDFSVTDEGWVINYKIDADECKVNPCQNGATCFDAVGNYTCRCVPGYRGRNCDEIDYCTPNPCQNNGQCVNNATARTHNCSCTLGYQGQNCTIPRPAVNIPISPNLRTYLRYRNDTGIRVTGPYFITFSVMTCETAFIALAQNISDPASIEESVIWEIGINRQIPSNTMYLRPCRCNRNEKSYELPTTDCSKAEDYWLAWSRNAARLGLGRIPGENEVQSLVLHHEVRPADLHVVVAEGRDIAANWTIYRQTNFTTPIACGGNLRPKTTEIQKFASPGFPGGYSPKEHCEWILAATREREIIMLRSDNFETDPSQDCKLDQVVIYEGGTSLDGTRLDEICGVRNYTKMSKGNVLSVVFTTSDVIEYRGFVFEYYALRRCGGYLDATTAVKQLISQGYNDGIGQAYYCVWTVRSPIFTRIRFSGITFNMTICGRGHLTFYNSNNTNENTSYASICTTQTNTSVISIKNIVTLEYMIEPGINSGFIANYSVVKDSNDCASSPCQNGASCVDGNFDFMCQCPSGLTGKTCNLTTCGGDFILSENKPTLNISIGGMMLTNKPHESCAWRITAPSSKRIRVNFTGITASNPFCKPDNFVLMDVNHGDNALDICNTLGQSSQSSVPIRSNIANFLLKQNLTLPELMNVSLQLVHDEDDCVSNPCLNGGTCEDGHFGHSCRCPGSYAGHNCQAIDGNECLHNPCMNGGSCIDGVINYACICQPGFKGRNCTENDYCNGDPCKNGAKCQSLPYTFNCTCLAGFYGKTCDGTTVDTCGGEFNALGVEQHFASPGYPGRYQHLLDCTWNITAEEGHFIEITFDDFELEGDRDGVCAFDYVSIQQIVDDELQVTNTYCGSTNESVVSKNNSMQVVFKTDKNREYRGFRITYKTAKDYCHSAPCKNGGECNNIPEGFNCSCNPGSKPRPGQASFEKQDYYYRGPTCEESVLAKCGGQLNATSTVQEFASYGYPHAYPSLSVCRWNITSTQQGHQVVLEFKDFNVTVGSQGMYCDNDFVKVYRAQDKDEETYCSKEGFNKPPTIRSKLNSLGLVMQTNGYNEREGFLATYYSQYKGCASNPCQNGGTCTDESTGSAYHWKCDCVDGFKGDSCEMSTRCLPAPDAPKPCSPEHSKQCKEKDDDYQCVCDKDYVGKNCDQFKDTALEAKLFGPTYVKGSNPPERVTVKYKLAITKINDLKIKDQELDTEVKITQTWPDSRLKWNPKDYWALSEKKFDLNNLWFPHVTLENGKSITTPEDLTKVSTTVYSNGTVEMFPYTASFQSHCDVDSKWFPIDKQVCMLVIGIIDKAADKVTVRLLDNPDDLDLDVNVVNDNGRWGLDGVKVTYHEDFAGRLIYSLNLKRQGSYYHFMFLTPACIAALLVIIMLLLRPDFKVKYVLGGIVSVGMLVMFILLDLYIGSPPVLGYYYIVILVVVPCSLAVALIVVTCARRRKNPSIFEKPLPHWCAYILCTSYDNLRDDVADPLSISMESVGYMNPAFAGAEGAASGNIINLQDDNDNMKKGVPPDWEDFSESSTDPNDVKLHAASDTDSGLGTNRKGRGGSFTSSASDDVPIVGSSKKRSGSFHSGDEGGKTGRMNKCYLFSMIFDRVLLIGFIIMLIIIPIAYGTMRD